MRYLLKKVTQSSQNIIYLSYFRQFVLMYPNGQRQQYIFIRALYVFIQFNKWQFQIIIEVTLSTCTYPKWKIEWDGDTTRYWKKERKNWHLLGNFFSTVRVFIASQNGFSEK